VNLKLLLRRLARAEEAPVELEPRHERRERARLRRAAGGPPWSEGDRHVNPDGAREVQDVAPGTPGHGGRRTVGRRD
jgi:hypothetical protein